MTSGSLRPPCSRPGPEPRILLVILPWQCPPVTLATFLLPLTMSFFAHCLHLLLGCPPSPQSISFVSVHSSQGALTDGHLVLWVSEPAGPRRALPGGPRWSPGTLSHEGGRAFASCHVPSPASTFLYLPKDSVDCFFLFKSKKKKN